MSLILDALRKSEAERRRGQSPDLFSPTAIPPDRDAERPRTWPLLLLGAMLLVSAWLIWDSGEDAQVATGRVPLAADAANASPQAAEAGPIDAAPHSSLDRGPRATSPPPVPAAPVQVVPAERAPPAQPAPPPSTGSTATTPMAPAPPMEPAVPEAAPPPPVDEALPPVAALDAATRASLPALKLSMHVYADDPARRFAIVDGQRVGEGAVLGSGRVAQIRRDGVVIEVNARRVLLPKP